MGERTIGALAREAGVGVETIRFYQRQGLLREPPRGASGDAGGVTRRYGEDDLRKLRFIRSAKAAGFTLAEIGRLLDFDAADDRAEALALASARLQALDEQIAALKTARNALARLTRACAHGDAGPCPILTAFEP